jgi:hypothetical protein
MACILEHLRFLTGLRWKLSLTFATEGGFCGVFEWSAE